MLDTVLIKKSERCLVCSKRLSSKQYCYCSEGCRLKVILGKNSNYLDEIGNSRRKALVALGLI
jgi:hypothetical protein